MRHFRKLGLVVVLSVPGAAVAADLTPRAPQPVFTAVPVANWEGFYAGTFIAGSTTRFESSQVASRDASRGGSSIGALAGYNVQRGPYVFGFEADIAENYVKAKNAGATGLVAHDAYSLHSVHLRGRFGYDLGAFLPFVAGGLTVNESSVSVPLAGVLYGENKTRLGWNIGAGVDWRVPLPILGDTVLRAEYLYEGVPASDYRYDGAPLPINMKSGSHQIRGALIYTPTLRGWRAPALDAVDWSGGYAGVLAGYASAHVRTKTAVASDKLDADGGLGGLYAGRNFTFGNVVVGWEGATMLASINGDGVVPGTLHAQSYRSYFETDLRGRLGYAFGRFLPFIAAGGAFSRSEQSDQFTLSHRGKVSTDSWTIGAGLDYMLMEGVSARLEYLHQKSWKDADVDLNGVAMKQSRSADLVRAGIAWHFH